MKKIFTLALALMGFAGAANAATVDDLAVLKHSYVLVIDDYSNNGLTAIDPGLIGDDHFLVLKQMPVATNKGTADLSTESEYVTADIVAKYGEYGEHLNSARLKDNSITMAMNLTAGSKVIMFIQGNNKEGKEARIPKISKKSDLSEPLNEAPAEGHPMTVAGYRWEITVDDDGVYYVGSYNGDMFVSYIIIEANEAVGTPMVKVGNQTFENGLWYKEVTCTPMPAEMFGESFPTVVTYTTDGSTPTADSDKYTGAIKCYSNQMVKFQAFLDFGGGTVDPEAFIDGADNEAAVNFKFDAPTIEAEGANVTITSPYEGATNYYALGTADAVEGSSATLAESATVTAYSKIVNGTHATFTTNSTIKDVYVLNPIKEKKTIKVTDGDVVIDEEATANSTTGTVYKVENGAISADKMDFFVKNLEFAVVTEADYQIDGEQRYIKMNNTNISFEVAEGDSVDVKVITSKNSCKTLNADDDPDVTTDRKNYVNVNGATYGNDDVTAENGNIIEFGLAGGQVYTFQKYSGTGNIMIASIEITPVGTDGISSAVAEKNVNAPVYNLAGQKVDASYKGLIIKNGQKMIQK